jgi:hypothetical protein
MKRREDEKTRKLAKNSNSKTMTAREGGEVTVKREEQREDEERDRRTAEATKTADSHLASSSHTIPAWRGW